MLQQIVGGDLRIAVAGIYLNAEYVRVDEDEGHDQKITSLGVFPLVSAFHERGYYVQLAYGLAIDAGPLHKITAYARYERRHAWFEGFTPLLVDRITGGLRVDLWEAVIVKGEILVNRELAGAPDGAQQRPDVCRWSTASRARVARGGSMRSIASGGRPLAVAAGAASALAAAGGGAPRPAPAAGSARSCRCRCRCARRRIWRSSRSPSGST